MKRTFAAATTAVLVLGATPVARAATWYWNPHFGLSAQDNSGVVFGTVVTRSVTDAVSVGPVFAFSTSGRDFERGTGENARKTEASRTWLAGARVHYEREAHPDWRWRLSAGLALLRFTAIESFRDGARLSFPEVPGEPGRIKPANRVAASLGAGTFFPVNDRVRIAVDVNVSAGRNGSLSGETDGGTPVDLSNRQENDTFILTMITIGLELIRSES